MPTGYNSDIYRNDSPALVDAAPIITLRASGALLFGKTITTGFAAVADGGPSTNPELLGVIVRFWCRCGQLPGTDWTWYSDWRKHYSTGLL